MLERVAVEIVGADPPVLGGGKVMLTLLVEPVLTMETTASVTVGASTAVVVLIIPKVVRVSSALLTGSVVEEGFNVPDNRLEAAVFGTRLAGATPSAVSTALTVATVVVTAAVTSEDVG